MKMNIGTLASTLIHGDIVVDLLLGANTMQTVDRLRQMTTGDPSGNRLLAELMAALSGLERNLRTIRQIAVDVGAGDVP